MAEGQKPSKSNINFKDLPPSGKLQSAAREGIMLDPHELAEQEAREIVKILIADKGRQTQGGDKK